MISTACAAVLAMTGAVAAQGMNEHGGGKNAPAAHERGQAPAQHMNQGQPGRASGAQQQHMNRGGSAQNTDRNRGGARETTGQGAQQGAQHERMGQDNNRGGKAGSERMEQKSGAGMRDREQKSNAAKDHDRNTGAAANERHERNNERAGRNEQNNERAGRNDNNERGGRNENGRSTTGSAPHKEVKLTTEQRTKIRNVTRNVVIKEHKIPRLTKVNFTVRVGVRVPRTVTFYPVPAEIVAIYPAWSSYKVIFVNDELVLIDPATYEIMYVVPV
jgi:hypothetical protein